MFESGLLVMITMLDIWWTLFLVKSGLAVEANPLLARFLEFGTAHFVGVKMVYLIPTLVILEWIRGFRPALAIWGMRVAVWGYVAVYAIGSLKLHGLF